MLCEPARPRLFTNLLDHRLAPLQIRHLRSLEARGSFATWALESARVRSGSGRGPRSPAGSVERTGSGVSTPVSCLRSLSSARSSYRSAQDAGPTCLREGATAPGGGTHYRRGRLESQARAWGVRAVCDGLMGFL